jgi:hypothetical protein
MRKGLPLLLLWVSTASPQTVDGLPRRETLYYDVEWRLITAGKVKLQWQAGQAGWQANVHVESVGLVSKLFKVVDDYSANIQENLCAESTQLSSQEGSRSRETKVTYDEAARKAIYMERDRAKNVVLESKETPIPACVHDIVGGLFFLRTLNLEPGQSVNEPVSDGKKSVMARVEAQQREDVKTPAGVVKTIRYEIYLFNGVLYKRPAHLNVWVTDDHRKLPVEIRVRMSITVGTITLMLEKEEE